MHENSDLLMKFRKEDEKNALLTEQNEREVLFCTVTSRLLHDDAKIHATSARLYNVLENWWEMKSKKISNDQELIQSDPTSCPQNQKGNN